ncbi:Hypothetical protein NGAL_HAMBI490_30050 [Neorhizobium galegae bv. officinalis]|nr:Hypothetical protein NGAL_HAMBI490_30050 [Neorhizobium galegae bv. officinalis]
MGSGPMSLASGPRSGGAGDFGLIGGLPSTEHAQSRLASSVFISLVHLREALAVAIADIGVITDIPSRLPEQARRMQTCANAGPRPFHK